MLRKAQLRPAPSGRSESARHSLQSAGRQKRPEIKRQRVLPWALRGCSNPIYIGEIRHKGLRHPGLQESTVDRELWDRTQLLLGSRKVRHAPRTTKSLASPLTRKLFDESGLILTPSHAVKGERRYRYYVSHSLIKRKSKFDGTRLALASARDRAKRRRGCLPDLERSDRDRNHHSVDWSR